MRVLNNFKFFDNEANVKESNVLANTQGSILVLQVSGDASNFKINAYGQVDLESNDYAKLQAINVESYDISQDITSNGIYNISIDGISKVYLDLSAITSGQVTVYGKVGE